MLSLLGIGSDFHRSIFLVIFALLIGVAAFWLGLLTVRQARQAASARPRTAIFGAAFGAIGATLSVLLLVAFGLFWKQLSVYSHCLGGANTLSAQHACQQQLNRSLHGEFGRIG